MSLDNFIPAIWSARLFEALRKAHVFPGLVNTDYEGEISAYGDQVKINSIGAVTVAGYTKNTDIDPAETLDDAQTILEINQAKYFNFQIDDIDAAQQRPKVMDAAMQEAAYRLADAVDSHIAGLHASAHATVTQSSLTASNTIAVLGDVSQKLSEANVPQEGRFIVLPPLAINYLVQEGLAQEALNSDADYRAGYVARAFGLDIYQSNNLKVYNTSGWYGLAGTRRAISFAEQISSVEAYRPELRFANAVKGLLLFGAKVIDPNALVRVALKKSAG